MTSNEILKADLLDILFDNRNKKYGAYSLRRKYNSRLGIALAITLGIAFSFLVLPIPGENNQIPIKAINDEILVKQVIIPKEAKQFTLHPQLPKLPRLPQNRAQNPMN